MMGNKTSQRVPDRSDHETQRTVSRITAQDGSVAFAPQISGVHVQGNVNMNVNDAELSNYSFIHLPDYIPKCRASLKSFLDTETRNLFQGTKDTGSSSPLDKIYTELYITEGESGGVNSEHEVTELQRHRSSGEEKKIILNDIFKPLPDEDDPPRIVLTKGIAGIGKTVSVRKFTQDWARGKANQTIQFLFPFTFRELNLSQDKEWSLMELIGDNFDEVKDLEAADYEGFGILFIFDGLDESKLSLNFNKHKICRSITEPTTVDVLLTNLIRGKLLHQASIWITGRPAACTTIPPEFINRVTEVRGFTDEQKKEYLQKQVRDKKVAKKILKHLLSKPLRSLYIMCHIPIFCWISGTTLQSLLTKPQPGELPKTLSGMYTHFLIVQTQITCEKDYDGPKTDMELIMKLGKLAFEQLRVGNMIFDGKVMEKYDIDLKQAADYSGVCTQIIKKEYGLHKQEMYCFIHLSVQEFLAALYVLETFICSGENVLPSKTDEERTEPSILLLHRDAVNMALDSKKGQWDLFLRFLLGLSQDNNQRLIQKVFGFEAGGPRSNEESIHYIHQRIRRLSYHEQRINLFHCLNELGDQTLVKQVQQYQNSGDVSKLLPQHWSALAYLLLVSYEDLDLFDLKKFSRSEEVLERLLHVFKESKVALLDDCGLTDRSCRDISSVLSSESCSLVALDLSRNKFRDTGMALLAEGLQSPNCKLQKLVLSDCGVTKEGCQSLARALTSNPSHLRELDLSKNRFCDEGLEPLSEILNRCSLETLSLFNTNLREETAAALASALNPARLKELDLGGNVLGDGGVEQISGLLRNPVCKVETLRLSGCRFSQSGCVSLASSLKSNPAHLRVLDLSRNQLTDEGVGHLSEVWFEPSCELRTLSLSCCSLTSACCPYLTDLRPAATGEVRPCPALKDLDLSHNLLKDEGVELLCDWLRKSCCCLEVLRLSRVTDSSCRSLASALKSNISLKELDLSQTDPEGSGVKLLTDVQRDGGAKLQTLTVRQ
ncbi:NACHT%2C LRR and PYD domains-containing protein 3-like isoform X8 [Xyrichtys novacula]|uniref:NACHT, LRR and PYD domains-containing protein 3-like isoform X8 n=1 Tax=Xyrichtys novacula TaxID=13765 RepID=A0AAV1EZK8_XYRNO|nr:NACHT%2C LRR and PYD domains-containing protein 3-like isoform X8 [Xyrichtys novacula]